MRGYMIKRLVNGLKIYVYRYAWLNILGVLPLIQSLVSEWDWHLCNSITHHQSIYTQVSQSVGRPVWLPCKFPGSLRARKTDTSLCSRFITHILYLDLTTLPTEALIICALSLIYQCHSIYWNVGLFQACVTLVCGGVLMMGLSSLGLASILSGKPKVLLIVSPLFDSFSDPL